MADDTSRARGESNEDVEENNSQRQSDAAPDAVAEAHGDLNSSSDRAGGMGSTANGLTAEDEADGELRKKQYRDGATLVSRMD